MTQRDLEFTYEKLDEAKWQLLADGVAFRFIVLRDSGEFMSTGIGNGEQMSMIAIRALAELYYAAKNVTPEEYIDSVKEGFMKFIEEDQDTDYEKKNIDRIG